MFRIFRQLGLVRRRPGGTPATRRRPYRPRLEELEPRYTPAAVVSEFALPTTFSYPAGITAGPDGALWFTEAVGNMLGRITTAGIVTEFAVPASNSRP